MYIVKLCKLFLCDCNMSTFHNAEENKLKQFISHNKEVLHEKFNDNDIQELLSNFDDQCMNIYRL